ncbi:unnamed protein product [Vitrella brassicaformis CCMP3155]|uniref:Protein kinase domain-containing protein n=1 Tax=Vitrella brassicaformis (strain CCMP3155) TaxID=1169540 RepID=A0A0G4EKK9_VITBC|nr:unnamed protein product [Vitrella brassicaformis CCMP3155]|eukprot:CEL96958.1 unnamed protein product [Vitrella brassicaformis CCMP3155]
MAESTAEFRRIDFEKLNLKEKEDALGAGSSGIVRAGEYNGHPVAIKYPSPQILMHYKNKLYELYDEVMKEVSAMVGADHSNLAKVYGVCLAKGDAAKKYGVMIVMELCSGGSLRTFLEKMQPTPEMPLPESQRNQLIRHICKAVNYLHTVKGIIHRDLKPENVLLSEMHDAKVTDFGRARQQESLGTEYYTAPEAFRQRTEAGDISYESDIWSLGGIISEILGGPMPFQEYSKFQIHDLVERQKKKPFVPDFPFAPHAKAVIEKCFEYNLKKRPSALEILDLLKIPYEIVSPAQEPSIKTPPSSPQPQIKYTDIFDAVKDGNEQSAKMLIEKEGKDILDKRDDSSFKYTPFHRAALKGHVGIMLVMYESKPDVLQQTDEDGSNALHWAAEFGHFAVVNKLMEWDSKLIDARTKYGMTPFMHAAQHGYVDVMKAVYAKGGENLLTQKNNFRWTALHGAAFYGHSAAVSQLLEWGGGALLDIKNNKGETPWDLVENKPDIREIMEKYNPACGPCCVIM